VINKTNSRIVLAAYSLIVIAFLFSTLAIEDHHPDGRMLQFYLCNVDQPWVSNGIAFIPYKIFTNCEIEGVQLPVIFLNILFIGIMISILTKYGMEISEILLAMMALSFLLYSVFFPSKEILLSLLLILAINSNSNINRYIYIIILSMIRPAYFPIIFYKSFNNKYKILFLIAIITIFIVGIQRGFLGDYLGDVYFEKQSEYNGIALLLFESLGDFSYPLRIIWNFLGIFGTIFTFYNAPHWHIFMHIGTQICLFIIFLKICSQKLKCNKINDVDSIFMLFIILTATWPIPHTRYLYPLIFAYIYYSIKISNYKL